MIPLMIRLVFLYKSWN